MGYFKDTVKGFGWMGALRAFMVGIGILKIAILARILSPSQFGVYGIALLILGLLEVLTETGINVFLIQEKSQTERYLNSAWVVSILRGILISLLIFLSAPLVSSFFVSPNVTPLLYLTALVSLVRGFVNPMEVSFQKNLQFSKEFVFKGSLYLTDAAVAVVLAYFTKSPSALVIGLLAAAVVEIVVSFTIFKSKPVLAIDWKKIKEVVNRGKWITGAGTFSYLSQHIDDMVVGKLLGAAPLGLYQQAYRVSTLPVTQVGEVFNKVTFPVYVQIGGDKERLKKAFIKTFLVILGLVAPFAAIIYLFSHPLILIFLGDKWLSAEPALKILAIFAILKSVVNSSYSLFLSLKKQDIVMYSELLGILGISISIVPLVNRFGLVGAGYSTIIGALVSMPLIYINLRKVFNK